MEEQFCPFEKTLLSTQFACEYAERTQVGERVMVVCREHIAHTNCGTVLGLMKEKARFVFKQKEVSESLPFGKKMKILYGGLLGLQKVLIHDSDSATTIGNIHGLIVAAKQTYGSLQDLPYNDIVQSISAYQLKRRRETHK